MHSGKWSGEELSAGDVDVGMSKGMEGGHQAQMGLKLGLEAARDPLDPALSGTAGGGGGERMKWNQRRQKEEGT